MPLRLRLAALFALATAVAIAVGGFVFVHQLRADLTDTIDRGLHAELAELAQELTATGHAPPLGPADDPILVESLNGTVLAASPAAAGRTISLQQRQAAITRDLLLTTDAGGARERVLISTVEAAAPTGRVFVAIGNNTSISDAAVERVRDGLLLTGPLTALFAGLGAWLLADAALRPVQRMRREAIDIGRHGPGRRLAIPATRDEIAALGATINGLLDRMNSELERERRFVAEASCELHEPLAVLHNELELAIRPGRSAKAIRAAVTDAGRETERLSRLTDDLLLLARADAHQSIVRPVPVLLAELLNTAIAGVRDPRTQIHLDCPQDLRVVADPDRLAQAVGNLLDNAITYSPPDTAIQLTAARGDDGRISIAVIDAGPGLSPDIQSLAFERFQRAEQPSSHGSGLGLGLSIVRVIAEAHGGSAEIVNCPEGGARATIRLPLIPPLPGGNGASRTPVPPQRGGSTSMLGVDRPRPTKSPWPVGRPQAAGEGAAPDGDKP